MRTLDELINEAYHSGYSLSEWIELTEKINNGEEISKGKSPTDTSKVGKTEANPDMANPEDMGDEEEGGLEDPEQEMEEGPDPGIAPGPQGEETPPMDPSAAPGSQIAIGNKVIKKENDPRPVRIKVSGQKQKIDTKPKVVIDPSKDGIGSVPQ